MVNQNEIKNLQGSLNLKLVPTLQTHGFQHHRLTKSQITKYRKQSFLSALYVLLHIGLVL